MGSQVQQALRTLCVNTQWKYAVFWRLQHRTRMMLTCEDAYYNNDDHPENKWFSDTMGDFQDGHYSSDSVGLAVAKMSYHVYSLGEGIVGQVAVTGKHLWISADDYAMDPGSLFEVRWCYNDDIADYCDGLQTQFSAGIKTIAVVAVVPHGVVQLGALDRIAEDLRMVNYVRNILYEIQDSIVRPPPNIIKSATESSCLSDMSTRTSNSKIYYKSTHSPDKFTQEDGKPGDQINVYSPPGGNTNSKVEMIDKDQRSDNLDLGKSGCLERLLEPELQKQEEVSVFNTKCERQSDNLREFKGVLDSGVVLSSENHGGARISSYDAFSAFDYSGMDISYFSPEIFHLAASNDQNGALSVKECSSMHLPKDSEKLELQYTSDHMDALLPTRFCAGDELYEALGPAFHQRSIPCDLGAELTDTTKAIGMHQEMCSSSREHLLEAVIAKVNHNDSNTNCEIPCHKSAESPLKIMKKAEPCSSDVDTISSVGYSFDQSLNSSGAYSIWSSKGVSPSSSSKGSGLLERPQEPAKVHKKRARPGESSRPRPRDRQLIQDRIRELRELVPNGTKCSIDSLLERTIKHTLFMQSITKHADKLNRCTTSKLLDKEMGFQVSSCDEQGSSWAVEVGSNLKVCPIIVENINVNGQMLIEMLCEECSHFLEVAEAIRSLGLTILKGVTETSGEKTWMRFVVEGHTNRSMHRMDILWSLMQLLQPKTNT